MKVKYGANPQCNLVKCPEAVRHYGSFRKHSENMFLTEIPSIMLTLLIIYGKQPPSLLRVVSNYPRWLGKFGKYGI